MVAKDGRGVPIQDPATHHQAPDTVDVLGVAVHRVDRVSLTRMLCNLIENKKRGWLSCINVEAVNLSHRLPWYRQFLRDSLVNYCDGEGVRLGSRILGTPLPERIGLTYWIYDILDALEKENKSVYFLGSAEAVIEKAVHIIRARYPSLRIAGFHNGYLTQEDDGRVVDLINQAAPDLLIVGMGMPKQERWIIDHQSVLQVPLMLNAGGCFDSIASKDLRVRAWTGRFGLEWLYRLLREPRRLWVRYLIGNPLFIARILRARWQLAIHHESIARGS